MIAPAKWMLALLSAAMALTGISASQASDLFDPSPIAKAPTGVADRKRRDYDPFGFRMGSFIFYPTVLSSVGYDDNIFATRTNKTSDVVFHIIPSITAAGNFGKTSTSAYLTADGRISTRSSSLSAISPSAGWGFNTEIQRDLTVQGRVDYGYKLEDPSITNELAGAGTVRDLVRYHDLSSSLSVNKSFDSFYLSAGAAVQLLRYEDATDVLGLPVRESLRDANLSNFVLRGGYEVMPGVKLFAEPSYNFRHYRASLFDSEGWRMVGGASMEFGRLVTGEVFAGYQRQDYENFNSISGFTAGGNVRWYPTELLTVSLRGDRTIQDSGLVVGGANGRAAIVTSLSLQADYELLRNFILSPRIGYQHSDYRDGTGRRINLYTTGMTATYLFNRLMTGSLDYKFSKNDSNFLLNRYVRNQFTASLKAQF